MKDGIIIGYDAAHSALAAAERQLPPGSLFAGYATGSPDVMWTPADWARHPGALRIDQDINACDYTADYLDVESGAASPAEAADWYRKALDAFRLGKRPGQRHPCIYVSASRVHELVTALTAGKVTGGPGLIVADWDLSQPEAVQMVLDASGPFPVTGVQFKSSGDYDINVFSGAWVHAVAGSPPAVEVPPGQWKDPSHWSWRAVTVIGTGLNGRLYMFELDTSAGTWEGPDALGEVQQ